jgi:uncharacterized membrane protein
MPPNETTCALKSGAESRIAGATSAVLLFPVAQLQLQSAETAWWNLWVRIFHLCWSSDAESVLPRWFLALAIPFGLAFALLLPPLQAPDEMAHLLRSYSVSTGTLIPPRAQKLPTALATLATAFPPRLEEVRSYSFDEFRRRTQTPWKDAGEREQVNPNANVYSFVPYLVSAAGLEAAKLALQPPIILLYAARFANLIFYIAIVYVALRVTPVLRPALFCLALMPMALHQGASVSADAPTIAGAFLFFAYVLYLAFDKRVIRVSRRQTAILGGLLLFSTLCKFNPWIGLAVALVPAPKFPGVRRKVLTVTALLGAVLFAGAIWQVLDRPNVVFLAAAKTNLDIYGERNISFVLHQPATYAGILLRTWRENAAVYPEQFVGRLGWLSVELPGWLAAGYLGFLLLVSAGNASRQHLTWKNRLLCGVIVAGSALSTFVLLWVLEMHAAGLVHPETATSPGMQGRYFIPLAPVAFLALANRRIRWKPAFTVAGCIVLVLVADIAAIAAVRKTYYYQTESYYDPGVRVNRAGLYRDGMWVQDDNGRHDFDATNPGAHHSLIFGGLAGDIPVTGDWTGSGERRVGVYRHGLWVLDWNGNGISDPQDRTYAFGGLDSDIPVVGDWSGDGRTKLGVYRGGAWLLDLNGDGKFEEGVDAVFHFGGTPDDIPVVGDWSGTGTSKIGLYRSGVWLLDWNGNGRYDEPGSAHPDKLIHFRGQPGDIPIVGNWAGDGKPRLGFVRQGSTWIVDFSGDYRLNSGDLVFSFGAKGFVPVLGPWAP